MKIKKYIPEIVCVLTLIFILTLFFYSSYKIHKENHKYDDIKINTLEELNQWVYINIIYKKNGVEDIYMIIGNTQMKRWK